MRIMIKEVGRAPYMKDVKDDFGFRDMQDIVGGFIEHLSVSDTIDMWLNDEGKLIPLPTNIFISYNGELSDSIQGDIFFTSHDDEGETVGLSEEDEKELWDMYSHMMMCHDPFKEDSPVSLYPVIDIRG